jgi:hypothetical protein
MKVKSWSYESTPHQIASNIQLMIETGEITEIITLTMSTSDGNHKSHNAILIYK